MNQRGFSPPAREATRQHSQSERWRNGTLRHLPPQEPPHPPLLHWLGEQPQVAGLHDPPQEYEFAVWAVWTLTAADWAEGMSAAVWLAPWSTPCTTAALASYEYDVELR
jgi:hypothetical protein